MLYLLNVHADFDSYIDYKLTNDYSIVSSPSITGYYSLHSFLSVLFWLSTLQSPISYPCYTNPLTSANGDLWHVDDSSLPALYECSSGELDSGYGHMAVQYLIDCYIGNDAQAYANYDDATIL